MRKINFALTLTLLLSCTPDQPLVRDDTVQSTPVSEKKEPLLFILDTSAAPDGASGGQLLLNNQTVPSFFLYVEDAQSAYTCYDEKNDKHLLNYRKIAKRKMKNSQLYLSPIDRERSYYLGSQRKVDAYESEWLYAEWEGGSAYFFGEKFLETINEDPFGAIFRKK